MMKSLIETNPYLHDPKARRTALWVSAASSSTIEGICMTELKRLTSNEVRRRIIGDQRDFFDTISKRKVTIGGFDFDDGCTAFADFWDEDGEDYEFVDRVDLSCLAELPEK